MFLKAGRARMKDLIFVGFLEISQAGKHLSPGVAGVVLDGIIPTLSVENVVGVHADSGGDQTWCVLHHSVIDQSDVTNGFISHSNKLSKDLRKKSSEFRNLRVGSLESSNESVEVVEWSNRTEVKTKGLFINLERADRFNLP